MTIVNRLCLTSLVLLIASGSVSAQTPAPVYPVVTVGVVSFLEYSDDLEDVNGFNAFDVTRGYIDIHGQLSRRVRVRFTPDVRPTTDASLVRNLTLRLAYASLEADVSEHGS